MSALNRARSRSQVLEGATPRVSLLPPSQRAALKHEKTLPKLLLMIVASAAVAALIAGAGFVTAMFAQQRLEVLDAESNALITQLAEFGEVQQLLSRSQTLTALRQEATGEEVMFIDLRDEIADIARREAAPHIGRRILDRDGQVHEGIDASGDGVLLGPGNGDEDRIRPLRPTIRHGGSQIGSQGG